MRKKRQRSPEQSERYNAFQQMAKTFEAEMKGNTLSEETKVLTRQAQSQPGLQRFSELNQLLILKQRPNATEVHTFQEWRGLGRRVVTGRGEKGIYVRKPRQVGAGEESHLAFWTICEFDITQTEPLPENEVQETVSQDDDEE